MLISFQLDIVHVIAVMAREGERAQGKSDPIDSCNQQMGAT